MKYLPVLTCLFTVLSLNASAQQQEKPNVLFIISDDLTATAVSSYGNPIVQTPNIDRLASEGVRFTRAYSQFPVCGPSRASLMFGYYPNATTTYGYVSGRENVGPDKNSWSQLFKENGYYTARVSKIYHMGVPGDILAGSNGTDDPASWTERFNSSGPEWKAEGEAELVQNNPYGKKDRQGGNVMTVVKADRGGMAHSDGKTAAKASELIRKHKDEPFFLAVGFVRPHVPFVAPKEYFEPYPYRQIELPPRVQNDWADIPPRGINYVTSVNARMSEEQEKKAIAAYYASVSYMDAQVGKVLQTLREEGLEDNTIVIFTSDHGYHLGEHRFWMKVSLHEESVRVPLIIKAPGIKPVVTNSLTELLDLYPTVADLAGLEYDKDLQGKSLVKTMKNPDHSVRDVAFSMHRRHGKFSYMLRSEKWAYIQYDEEGWDRPVYINGFEEISQKATVEAVDEEAGLQFNVASLPAIILLKLIAYDDRPENRPQDPEDIREIILNFFDIEDTVIYENHSDLFERDLKLHEYSAIVIGRQMKDILAQNERLRDRILTILSVEDRTQQRMAEAMTNNDIPEAQVKRWLTLIIDEIQDLF